MKKRLHYVNTLAYQLEAVANMCRNFSKNWFASKLRNRITFDEYAVLDMLVCYSHLDEAVRLLAKFISENELVTFTKTLLKIKSILISLDNADVLA